MKITFIEPSFSKINADDAIFPFGFASLGALLKKNNFDIEYILPAAQKLSFEKTVLKALESNPDIFAIGGLLPYMSSIAEIVDVLKKKCPEKTVIIGGPIVTHSPILALTKINADLAIKGEGEIPLIELVKCLNESKPFDSIKGLVYRKNGQIIDNGMPELMDINDIPFPDWEDFPMEYYLSSNWWLPGWSRSKPPKVIHWMFSRGCPMKCNFCVSGTVPRLKNIDDANRELDIIIERFNPDYIILIDDFLVQEKKFIRGFCQHIVEKQYNFKFSATARASSIDLETLNLLKSAGCEVLFYGLECANDKILKFMKKGITCKDIDIAVSLTKSVGIHPMVSIMFGQPGEVMSDFYKSIKKAISVSTPDNPAPNIASVMQLLTFPGTGIYQYAQSKGYFSDELDYWEKYGDNFRINYTKYSQDIITDMVNSGNTMIRWKYYICMAKSFKKQMFENLLNSNVKLLKTFYKTKSIKNGLVNFRLMIFFIKCILLKK